MADELTGMPGMALEWHRAGRGAALATVIETWGSAPRRAGAQLAIAGDGAMEGSVSGGCVEGAVVVEAMDALADGGGAQVLEYGVADADAFAVGLACGGTIRVLVEPVGAAMPEAHLERLVAARAARRPVAHVTDLSGGGADLRGPGEDAEVDARLRADRSGLAEDGRLVVVHNPPLRMVIVGAVHIAQALVPMARIAGFDPVVVDPRPAFGSAARFPDTRLSEEWPDAAMAQIGLDARTAVVTLTHDPKLDDPAIRAALASEAFYVGCLGSTRTHGKRTERLQGAVDAEALARIHAPVGLDIGAAGPAEIAVAVLAEIVQALRRP